MKLSELDIGDAQAYVELTPDKTSKGTKSYLPDDFSEVKLFALLKWQFGPPNGVMSLALTSHGDPDALFKWHYCIAFKVHNVILHIMRSWLGVEIHCQGLKTSTKQICDFIQKNIETYKNEINGVVESLETYTLIINPFYRHKRMAQFAFSELSKLTIDEPYYPKDIIGKQSEIKKHEESISKHIDLLERQNFYATSLVIHNAFYAESYINIVIALLAKNEIANSKEKFNLYIRKPWKERLKGLPTYCNHIVKNPDIGDSRVRNIKLLFDLRNRIAHSYPDKEELKYGHMYFDNKIPILQNANPFDRIQYGVENILPTKAEAIKSVQYAEEFLMYIDELIDEKVLPEVEFFSNSNPVGYNESQHVYSIPFADYISKAFFPVDNKTNSKIPKKQRRR